MADRRVHKKNKTGTRARLQIDAPDPGRLAAEPTFYFREAADVTGVAFHQGEQALEGRWLSLIVNFATHGSPDGNKWCIWPHEAMVRLVRAGGQEQVPLGTFRTYLSESIRPDGQAHKSGKASMPFRRLFSPLEIAAIEEWRDGRDLDVKVIVYGYGKKGGAATWDYFDEYATTVPRSAWLDMLSQARLQEKVLVAVPVVGDPQLEEAGKYLRSAIQHHARGEYAAAAQTCRKALEEVGNAGFGKKAPKEVRDFIHHQDTKLYSLEERVAVIMMGAKMFYNAAAHAGDEERQWRRADADLAMAITAALLRVAPMRLTDAIPLAGSGAADVKKGT